MIKNTVIRKYLGRFRLLFWASRLGESFIKTVPWFAGLFLIVAVIGHFFRITPRMLLVLHGVAGCVFLVPVISGIVSLLKTHRNLLQCALFLESQENQFRNDFSNALQLSDKKLLGSEVLAAWAICSGETQIAAAELARYARFSLPGKSFFVVPMAFLLALAGLCFFSSHSRQALHFFLHPNQLSADKNPLMVFPGNKVCIQGDSLRVGVSNRRGESARIVFSGQHRPSSARMHYKSQDTAEAVISGTFSDFQYQFQSNTRKSGWFRVTVQSRPEIVHFSAKVHFPVYAARPPIPYEKDNAELWIPEGSRIAMDLGSSKKLLNARIVFADSSTLPMTISGHRASITLRADKDTEYSFRLLDMDSLQNRDSITRRLHIRPDAPPLVRFIEPEKDVQINVEMTIPLIIQAEDDFGISSLWFAYRILRENETIPVDSILLKSSDKMHRIDTAAHSWNLTSLRVYPGDEIEFWSMAKDNNGLRGPQTSVSEIRKARFPTAREIFEESRELESASIRETEEIHKKQEVIARQTENLRRKAETTTAPSSRQIAEWKNTEEEQNSLLSEIDTLSRHLQERFESSLQNNTYRENVLQKLQEVQRELSRLRRPEKENMPENQELTQDDLAELRKNLEELSKDQTDLLSRLEQALEMLREMSAENRLFSLAETFSELSRSQDSLRAQSQGKKNGEALSRQQGKLAAETEKAMSEMDRAARDSLLSPETRGAMESLIREMMKSRTPEQMKQAAQSMKSGKWPESMEMQNQAGMMLKKAAQQMMALSSGMRSRSARELVEKLNRMKDRLFFASFEQETLSTGNAPESRTRQEAISGQLEQILDSLIHVETAGFRDPMLMQMLGQALQNSKLASQKLSLHSEAATLQAHALDRINQSQFRLGQALDAMQSMPGKSGCSPDQMMESLFGMSAQQMKLNRWVENLFQSALTQSLSGNGTRERKKAASAQRKLLEQYNQLKEQWEQRPDMPGKLPDVQKEMDEIIRDLESGSFSQNTLDRQNKVLSRMLDGTQSMNQRDRSRKRESESARSSAGGSPPQKPSFFPPALLPGSIDYSAYPPEFHERIRRYLFESLAP